MSWPLVAGLALASSPVLLFRELPLSPWWLLLTGPGLMLSAWRHSLLLALGLVVWMAWDYQQVWQARWPVGPVEKVLRVQIEGEVQREASALRFDVRSLPDRHRIRLAWYGQAPALEAGQCWDLQIKARAARGSVNPGSFDYEAWLFREAYVGRGTVRHGRPCAVRDDRPISADEASGAAWQPQGSERARASLRALVWGDRSGLKDEDWRVLRRTGTSHLFAISGLHLGLVAGLAYGLGWWLWRLLAFSFLPRARDVAMVCSVLAACAYAWVSGFAVPVQRALFMCLLGLWALHSGRLRDAPSLLGLACCGVLLLYPRAVMTPGFWLSFVAAAGILAYLGRFSAQSRWQQLLGIQMFLGILLAPLSLAFFGGWSWLGVPVNLILVPLFGVLLPALFGALFTSMAFGLDWPLGLVLKLVEGLWWSLDQLAAWSHAFHWQHIPSWPWTVLSVVAAMCLLARQRWIQWLAAAMLVFILLKPAPRPQAGALWVWMLDVGQGQSLLLQTEQHDWLYDAGPRWPGGFDAGARIVVPALRALGVNRLHMLMISHADMDHAGGAGSVQQNLSVDEYRGSAKQPCRTGEEWTLDAVHFKLLHPEDASGPDNAQSCVLMIQTAGGRRILLSGDIEANIEDRLLARGLDLHADVLQVPHHGSRTSSSPAFVQAVAPELVLVAASRDNRWGFPASEVVARYQALQSVIRITGESGALQVKMDDSWHLRVWRDEYPRLWRSFAGQE